jgi:group I intron endonuclease
MTERKYLFVYRIRNNITGKSYIGKHETFNIDDGYFGSGIALKEAIKKYGRDNFYREILEFCETPEYLSEREKYWILNENSIIPNGYNISLGGKGGDNFTMNPNKEEILHKMKENRKPRKISDAERAEISSRMTGKKLKPHEKIRCEHCKDNISNANYKRWHGERCKKNPDRISVELPRKWCEYCKEYKNPTEYSINHGIYCKENPQGLKRITQTKECEYCNREISTPNYNKFHGENCRSNPLFQKNPELYKNTEAYSIKEKISRGNTGKILSHESKEKIGNFNRGKILSIETKNKMSETNKKRWDKIKESPIFYKCEHCNKEVTNKTNYIRWHGDNCKNNQSFN